MHVHSLELGKEERSVSRRSVLDRSCLVELAGLPMLCLAPPACLNFHLSCCGETLMGEPLGQSGSQLAVGSKYPQ